MQLHKVNDEVFYCDGHVKRVDQSLIDFLTDKAAVNQRRRCRICLHQDADSSLHEMLIMHSAGNYVPPHKHLKSEESSLILQGEGVMLYFGDDGQLQESIYLNADPNLGCNFVRAPANTIHSLYIHSDTFLFKETILGPFSRDNYLEPDWAAAEDDTEQVAAFMQESKQYFQQVKQQ